MTGTQTHLDKARVGTPPVDNAPLYPVSNFSRLALPVQLVETASRRTAAVLGVLRKRDGTLDAVGFHLARGLVGEGLRVAERNVCFVGCRGRMQFVEDGRHTLPLYFGVL